MMGQDDDGPGVMMMMFLSCHHYRPVDGPGVVVMMITGQLVMGQE